MERETDQKADKKSDQKSDKKANQKAHQKAEQKAHQKVEQKAHQKAEQKAKQKAEQKTEQKAEQKAEQETDCETDQETNCESKSHSQQESSSSHQTNQREILNAAMQAGHILLENGAEIFRVEETMDRICRHFGIESGNSFVLSNGIFTTSGNEREEIFAKVQHIPVSGTHLDRVAAVNQLSREIEAGQVSLSEVKRRLDEIRVMPGKSKVMQILASGVGSACFCYLFGGNVRDSVCAFGTGILLYLYVLFISAPRLSKIVGNIGGGALVTFICTMQYLFGIGEHLNFMIIGSIMPLIPGVPFTNAIRDIADGDYISGSVRMMDALLVFFSIAMGVGLVFGVFHRMTGGALL